MPAWPTTQVSLRKSMVPQMLRRHLSRTPSIQPNLITLPFLFSSGSLQTSSTSALVPDIRSLRLGLVSSLLKLSGLGSLSWVRLARSTSG